MERILLTTFRTILGMFFILIFVTILYVGIEIVEENPVPTLIILFILWYYYPDMLFTKKLTKNRKQ